MAIQFFQSHIFLGLAAAAYLIVAVRRSEPASAPVPVKVRDR